MKKLDLQSNNWAFMSISGLSPQLSYSIYPRSQCLAFGIAAACSAIGLFSLFQRYISFPAAVLQPKTDLRRCIRLTPSETVSTISPLEERERFYQEAKKTILRISKDLASHVCFNDQQLEICFKYSLYALEHIGFYCKKSGYPYLQGVDQSGFRIKGLSKAFSQFQNEKRVLHHESIVFFTDFSSKTVPVFTQKNLSSPQELFSTVFAQSQG